MFCFFFDQLYIYFTRLTTISRVIHVYTYLSQFSEVKSKKHIYIVAIHINKILSVAIQLNKIQVKSRKNNKLTEDDRTIGKQSDRKKMQAGRVI